MNDKKLSIVFVTNNYTPYQGGVVSSLMGHVEALQQEGHTVTLITLDFGGQQYEPHVIRLNCFFRFRYKTNPMAVPLCAYNQIMGHLIAIKPDIVHVHHPFLLGQAALKGAKKLGIPLIFTHHTFYTQYLHYIPLPKSITRVITEYRVRSFCNAVHGIIAPGHDVLSYLTAKNIATPIRIIPSAIAPIFFKEKPDTPQHLKKPVQLLTVSRFVKEKNIRFLLDVMTLLDPEGYQLTLVGYGSDFQALKAYAFDEKKLSLGHIRFVEKPSKLDLVRFYKKADIFVFSSLSETQGLVIAEAMAQGTPVIALDGPGQRDIIKDGYNGFLVQTRREMQDKIQRLAHDEALYQTLSGQAEKTAQGYARSHLTSQLVDFYYSLLK